MKMELNTQEKLKVALGEPYRKKIGGQEFEFYPLEVTSLQDFFELYSKFGKETDTKKITEIMGNKENSQIIVNLIIKMLKDSFPKETDEVLIKRFAMKYFLECQEVLMELHKPSESVDERKLDRLQELKQRIVKNKQKQNVQSKGENTKTSSP